MLFLFFAYSLTARALSVPAINDESTQSSCENINECRTLSDIVWSCITTIFLCTWVAIHPNISEPVDVQKMKFSQRISHAIYCFLHERLPLLLCAVLVPEYILAWALRQRIMARKIMDHNADLGLTPTHGFFIIMGGFHYYKHSNDPENAQEKTGAQVEAPLLKSSEHSESIQGEAIPVHPLTHQDVVSMVRKKQIDLPTKADIQDRSKSDWFAKTIVLVQTLWFVTQCIARRIERLPTTELEIVTLAYGAMNLGITIAWWGKPQNVGHHIRVFHQTLEAEAVEEGKWKILDVVVGVQDRSIELHRTRKVPIFYSGNPDTSESLIAYFVVLAAAVVFGAIHCIAWSFQFSSHTEAFLWRLSSVAITAVPICHMIAILGNSASYGIQSWVGGSLRTLLDISIPVTGFLYIAARFTTLVIALMNLSSLSPGAFQTVHWTTLIPHV